MAETKTPLEANGDTIAEIRALVDALPDAGSGGGDTNPTAASKAVNFIDFDGTIRYSYTLDEIAALTALPALPVHDGLVCQGWNWTLADIKALGREVTVGAVYITDDGKTRLYITIDQTDRMTVPIWLTQAVANGVTVDWGDGSAVETSETAGSEIQFSHTYAETGDYVIKLEVVSGADDARAVDIRNYGCEHRHYGNGVDFEFSGNRQRQHMDNAFKAVVVHADTRAYRNSALHVLQE